MKKKSPYGATFGIEHHANALNTILNQDFLFKMTEFQNLIIMLGIALLLGLIALLLLRKLYPRQTDATQALYLSFCKKISRSGIVRAAHEGPQDFATRAAKSLPQHAAAINDVSGLYLRLRYGGKSATKDLLALRRAVRAFKI